MSETNAVARVRVCIDAQDTERLAAFYTRVFGYVGRAGETPGEWRHLDPVDAALPYLTIQPVPEAKNGKNRLHLDVFVAEPDPWIAKAEAAGAARLWRSEDPDDWFQVLADPEGNELCICLMPTDSTQ